MFSQSNFLILLILLICWVNDIEFGGAEKALEVKEFFCLFVFLIFWVLVFSVDLVVSEIEIECFLFEAKN